ncbi:LysM domain-containing protein [Actinobaculum suis]|uniref:LysM domain-containing protein n=1 Tax=Actinobaculum suis TaxID=1657 RepID=A0A1G7CBG8_9ACTO|nr:LysM domain-containing protein [Actinobaculum suis]MDY5152954.1 LysM domain-containing protein [Actinobaculum suis]SDE36688.1 LysM domain-containing protein [Actinobaculum suis]
MKTKAICGGSLIAALGFMFVLVTEWPGLSGPTGSLYTSWLLCGLSFAGMLLSLWICLSYLALARAARGHQGFLVALARHCGTRKVRLALAAGTMLTLSASPALAVAAPGTPSHTAAVATVHTTAHTTTHTTMHAETVRTDLDLGWGGSFKTGAPASPGSARTSPESARARIQQTRLDFASSATRPSNPGSGRIAEASDPGPSSITEANDPATPNRETPAERTHIVQAGSTLWQIATYFLPADASDGQIMQLVNAIAQANQLTNPSLIMPGQELVIPAAG